MENAFMMLNGCKLRRVSKIFQRGMFRASRLLSSEQGRCRFWSELCSRLVDGDVEEEGRCYGCGCYGVWFVAQ